MSATVLRFNNRVTRKPSAPVKIDASALESPPAGSTGRVLLIGQADNGIPYNALVTVDDVGSFESSVALRAAYSGGDLKEAGAMCFKPTVDNDRTGAQQVITLKVNPDTLSSLTLSNSLGNAIVLSSRDYGPQTNGISAEVADGSGGAPKKKVTIVDNGVAQIFDNIGGTAMMSLQYREPAANGWDTATAKVLTTGVQAKGTRAETGKSTDLANPAIHDFVRVVSSSAGDTTQVLTYYALVSGIPTVRQLTLNGTTQVQDNVAIDVTGILGCWLSGIAVGTVTVSQPTGPVTLYTIAPSALAAGGVQAQGMWVKGALTLVADAGSAAAILLAGRDASGTVILEQKVLNGTTPVTSVTTTFKQLDFIGLTILLAARTLTISSVIAETANTAQTTLLKVRDFFNALKYSTFGFTAALTTTRSTFSPANLDITDPATPINIFYSATGSLFADNFLIAEALTNGSYALTAAVAPGVVGGAPTNTTTPQFLSGGSTGSITQNDWQACLDLARDIEFDTAVCLTSDPAVLRALEEMLDFKAGPGESEADGFEGILNAGLSDLATFTEIKAQIVLANNRNIRVCAQQFERAGTDGVLKWWDPAFLAALFAGAQAGTSLGKSLTNADMGITRFRQHSSWNPKDQVEDALEAGLLFLDNVRINGSVFKRVVRDVTSAVSSDNPAFTAGEANRILNFVARELRTQLRTAISEPGFSGTITALYGRAREKLEQFMGPDHILKGWKDLVISLSIDKAPVSVSVSPVFAINFVPITINLYDAPITVAG